MMVMVAYASTLPTTATSMGTSFWVTLATTTGDGPPPSKLRRPPPFFPPFLSPPEGSALSAVVEPAQPCSSKAAVKHTKTAHVFVRIQKLKKSFTGYVLV